jgi:hypothetical protein
VPAAVLVLVWIVQAIRVTHYIDFNDEMQYYAELVGLVANGRLFSTDLYIQQGVYLLTYPAFKLSMHLLGWSWLILSARALFALFVLWIFRRVRRSVESAGTSAIVASVVALGCTFAVPFMNIYAFSYNSVGLGVLTVCFAEFFTWRAQARPMRIAFWALSLSIALVAHPPIAVSTGVVLFARLWFDRDFTSMRRLAAALCGLVLLAAAVAYRLTTPSELQAAVAFSRAISVGAVLRAGLPWLIGVVVLAGALCAATQRHAPEVAAAVARRASAAALVMGLLFAIALGLATAFTWPAAFCCVFAGIAVTAWPAREQSQRRVWITVLFMATATAMALSSGNGFRQIQGPALVAAPFYLAMALSRNGGDGSWRFHQLMGRTFGAGLVAVLVTLFLANPYRDERLWHQTGRAENAPAFRGLFLTPAKVAAIGEARRVLWDVPSGSRVMIVGAQPWLYFATTTFPDTDMAFMHSYGQPEAYRLVAARLSARHPDYVIIAADAPDVVRRAVENEVRSGAYVCEARPVGRALENAEDRIQTLYAISPVFTVCRRVT